MIKNLFFTFLAITLFCVPAFAIEVPKEGKTILNKRATAYTSSSFNALLMACGMEALTSEGAANLPSGYARVADGKVKFNNKARLYYPGNYHAILTAYGLQISPDKVAETLGYSNYAKVVNGEVRFGKPSTAYDRSEWIDILSCYTLSAGMAAAPAPARVSGDADGDGVADNKDACPSTPKGIKVDARGCWTHSGELLFAFDSAEINKKYQSDLDDSTRVFEANPNMKVRIDGHTDDKGTEAYNQKLSLRRAQAVKDYLVKSAGININRLTVKGYGETRPAYPNDSEANRHKNRRVEFTPVQ